MIIILDLILMFVACAMCVPVAMFCLEVLLALWPRRRTEVPALAASARVAVLIPAHDEQAVIGATLLTLLPTVPAGSRVIVVADNCSDATGRIARECGAEVVERQDAARRGKGFALDFGIQHLSLDPPDAVVFLDADCRVVPDTVRLLVAAAIASERPVQGLNLCDPDPRGGVLQMISGLAFRFKNLIRTLGLVQLAGLNHLTGTGMALPWRLAQRAKLAAGNVVEDMQLGIDLALAGQPPMFLPEARVDSPLPQQRAAARTQRTRWEHGHLKTILKQTPRLLGLAIKHRRIDLAWLALDLAIPPLALLVVALTMVTAGAAAAWVAGASPWPLLIGATACFALGTAVILGWAVYCREQVPLFALVAAPLYVAAKLPIYLAFLVKRQQRWVRTERDPARS
ncbi:MAG TPA: glycosyltransferase family 2 protein [Pirellulaceae bacterium]|nr:glycosyltransferase family 2 protein [Pirellulaceae bacterium]